MQNGVSVIICCYNSANRLKETIKHLAAQEVSKEIPWEIIIVNNNSTDNTRSVGLAEIKRYPNLDSRFIIIDELKPGLSNARHKGVETAKYDYIIFCDDDNWLGKDYVETAFQILTKTPDVGACGGQSGAISDIEFPDWFDDYKAGYAVGKQGTTTGDISQRKYLWGSGLAFRKSLYIRAFEKLPSLLTDRKGSELSSGGDSEICMRFLLIGYRLFYSDELVFKHFIESSRLTITYRNKLFDGFSNSQRILQIYIRLITLTSLSRFRCSLTLIKSFVKLLLHFIGIKQSKYIAWDKQNIYFIAGIKIGETSDAVFFIKDFYNRKCNLYAKPQLKKAK